MRKVSINNKTIVPVYFRIRTQNKRNRPIMLTSKAIFLEKQYKKNIKRQIKI